MDSKTGGKMDKSQLTTEMMALIVGGTGQGEPRDEPEPDPPPV